jgi:hypothetical protein
MKMEQKSRGIKNKINEGREREALNKGRQNKREEERTRSEGRNRREKKVGRRAGRNTEVIRCQ